MYNKVILVGNLTRDIELRYSQGGMAIANAGLATSRKFTLNGEKKEEVCFVDITFFARSAEIANQYLRKGSKILVEGRLNFDQWVDQNGQKRSKHSVVVETMQMLDTKGTAQAGADEYAAPQQMMQPNQGYQQPSYQQPQSYQQPSMQQQPQSYQKPSAQQQMPSNSSIPVIDIDEDEIPF